MGLDRGKKNSREVADDGEVGKNVILLDTGSLDLTVEECWAIVDRSGGLSVFHVERQRLTG